MSAEREMEMLERLCTGLGATADQARAMAAQLIKRADQLAAERTIPREQAMRYLLEVVARGRVGEIASEYDRLRPPIPPDHEGKPDA